MLTLLLALHLFVGHPESVPAVTAVTASSSDMSVGYLHWLKLHSKPDSPPVRLKLLMPAIELYDPDGHPVYFGEGDATANAKYLDELNSASLDAFAKHPLPDKPSLRETIEMYPALHAQEATLMSGGRFTLVVRTYPNWKEALAQDEAVKRLASRLPKLHMREVLINLNPE